MHTYKDDFLINTLRFVSRKEASQIYGAVLPKCLTSPEMKESKAYKTYLGYAIGEVPPKVARKFKKAFPSKKESELVPRDEEPVKKGKRLKTPAKKSASKPATTQMKEVRKKSLRDFHKTYPSGSGTVAEKPPSVEKITPTVTSKGTSDKPGVPDVTNDDSSKSEYESWGNDEDDNNNEPKSSDESKEEELDQENESEDDEMKSDEEQGMDDTIDQFDDDADVRLEEPTEIAAGIVQGEGNDTKMTEAQQGNENLETTQEQVATPTPPLTFETTNPLSNLPDFSSVFRFNDRITALEKEVVDLKKDPLYTQVTSLVDNHLDKRLGETRQEFMNFLLESLNARIKEQVKDQLPQILLQEVSNFTPPVIEKLIKESRDEVTLAKLKKILLDKIEKSESYLTAPKHRDCYDGLRKSYALDKDFFYSYDLYSLKRGRNDKDKDEDPSAGSGRGLKKRKTNKDTKPTTGPKKKDSTSGSSKGTKSQPKSTGKSVEVADSDMPQD
ncbi:hypothetical protein Tco_0765275 [Tanacetum coccineum]